VKQDVKKNEEPDLMSGQVSVELPGNTSALSTKNLMPIQDSSPGKM